MSAIFIWMGEQTRTTGSVLVIDGVKLKRSDTVAQEFWYSKILGRGKKHKEYVLHEL